MEATDGNREDTQKDKRDCQDANNEGGKRCFSNEGIKVNSQEHNAQGMQTYRKIIHRPEGSSKTGIMRYGVYKNISPY
ncbi:hypothetical protein BEWA_001970 [Theileria equi strain WA]|uniref:Uncharacterized protein n=1 Tax=Theileria equi strain WA TaxID=1537102 RepID=L0AYZ9_THEEQ|nr:hypothetical protein BEWA_001970 [Theileria equi strain WA]AFZ80790.1 hypothetical protein BEWA_001970 [Theileria equi strain WA]|eukprot:XP_004830456.1 hypothetical protein BEWA_001970 [Theileria equi strain WA]